MHNGFPKPNRRRDNSRRYNPFIDCPCIYCRTFRASLVRPGHQYRPVLFEDIHEPSREYLEFGDVHKFSLTKEWHFGISESVLLTCISTTLVVDVDKKLANDIDMRCLLYWHERNEFVIMLRNNIVEI